MRGAWLCPRSAAAAAALNDQRNLAALTELACLTRARIIGNKATANQSPLLRLCFMKSPIPKGRLRVGSWIVQRLYNDAVYETVKLRLLAVF
jgi:hypothetical protein